ncbi:MAG TPA: cupin domain-containing protein [Polyangiaceae bacterium]|nr:cupin domain-containing protein [Polyangiaceae bacterium]
MDPWKDRAAGIAPQGFREEAATPRNRRSSTGQANWIAAASRNTEGIEGYIFDGRDGSQIAFWECSADAATAEHVHPFDEYIVVVEGTYSLNLNGVEVHLTAGNELFIPKGTAISGKVFSGYAHHSPIRWPARERESDQ